MTYIKNLDKINAITVSLEEINGAWNDMAESGGDEEVISYLLGQRFEGNWDQAEAAVLRAQALARLIEAGRIPNWFPPTKPEDTVMVNLGVFLAATVQPLVEIDGEPSFDAEEFNQKVLELAASEGEG